MFVLGADTNNRGGRSVRYKASNFSVLPPGIFIVFQTNENRFCNETFD